MIGGEKVGYIFNVSKSAFLLFSGTFERILQRPSYNIIFLFLSMLMQIAEYIFSMHFTQQGESPIEFPYLLNLGIMNLDCSGKGIYANML